MLAEMHAETDLGSRRWQSAGARWLGSLQGLFYTLTGVWPLLHLRSFIYVTGPKTDLWLVQTVGALIAVSGIALFLAARRRKLTAEWALLAAGQAGSLAVIDIVFVARDRISGIYLADAVVEIALVVTWLLIALRGAENPTAASVRSR